MGKYDAQRKAYISDTGRIYPTENPQFRPKSEGYVFVPQEASQYTASQTLQATQAVQSGGAKLGSDIPGQYVKLTQPVTEQPQYRYTIAPDVYRGLPQPQTAGPNVQTNILRPEYKEAVEQAAIVPIRRGVIYVPDKMTEKAHTSPKPIYPAPAPATIEPLPEQPKDSRSFLVKAAEREEKIRKDINRQVFGGYPGAEALGVSAIASVPASAVYTFGQAAAPFAARETVRLAGSLNAARTAAVSAASKAVQQQVTKISPSAGRFIGSRPGLAATGLAIETAGGIAITESIAGVGKATTPKDVNPIIVDQIRLEAQQQTAAQLTTKLGGYDVPSLSGVVYDVPGAPALLQQPKFESNLKKVIADRGITGQEAELYLKAAKRQQKFSEGGLAAGSLFISTGSELVGQRLVSQQFSRQAKTKISRVAVFKAVAPQTALAGFGEGFATEAVSQTSRREKFDPLKLIGYGAFGATTAGVFGGAIPALSLDIPTKSATKAVKNEAAKATGKFIEYSSYLADPYELPGDVSARQLENLFIRSGAKVKAPVISFTPTELVFGTSTKQKTATQTPARTQATRVPSLIKSIQSVFTPTPIPTPTPTPTITATSIGTPIPIPIPDIFTPTSTTTETPTPTPTQTFTNIPISTPVYKLPPPFVMPSFDFGPKGSGAPSSKSAKRYVNELEAAATLFSTIQGQTSLEKAFKSIQPKKASKVSNARRKEEAKLDASIRKATRSINRLR